ncbi:GWxTD domain-containing protein [Sulfidibacter corallicola]|uniref:GWxTD domain-containing protein n=1 Tax=Sulfidibacter corallicola TaxID=2818388 RepID=A0A8A4TMM4_SULCO|nr:GWxTD domain-containing protein [Sulfidibacter corallicola]QTD47845.1 GWxTD domain-containing protein [Sulfidibacter corallicola]
MPRTKWIWIALLVLSPSLYGGKRTKLNDEERAWLNKVDLIITTAERKTFRKRLTTHHQRKQFIELFWAKRDPDLSDNRNPFRENYLARYDFAMAHFERKNVSRPMTPRSHVLLLLGKPTKIEYRLDFGLVGFRTQTRLLNYRPELWIYEDPPFEFRPKRLRVQFLPINSWGDYVSVTDPFTGQWLRTLKHKFIMHPDLEMAPVPTVEEEIFSVSTDRPTMPSSAERADGVPHTGPKPATVARVNPTQSAPVSSAPVPVTAPEPAATPSSMARAEVPTPDPTPPVAPPTTSGSGATPVDKLNQTDLMVPSMTTSGKSGQESRFSPEAGNAANLRVTTSFFKRGQNQGLFMGRIGFPLKSLDFRFQSSQYEAPFILDYAIVSPDGQVVLTNRIKKEVLVPRKELLEREGAVFSEAFAVILPSDRYSVRMQLFDVNGQETSYHEIPVELARLNDQSKQVVDFVLMDPNVDPKNANFTIRDQPFTLNIAPHLARGDRIYPVLELSGAITQPEVDSIVFRAVRQDKTIQQWQLFPEEVTVTPQGTVLIHPILESSNLAPGPYDLHFEMELSEGELLTRKLAIEVR